MWLRVEYWTTWAKLECWLTACKGRTYVDVVLAVSKTSECEYMPVPIRSYVVRTYSPFCLFCIVDQRRYDTDIQKAVVARCATSWHQKSMEA